MQSRCLAVDDNPPCSAAAPGVPEPMDCLAAADSGILETGHDWTDLCRTRARAKAPEIARHAILCTTALEQPGGFGRNQAFALV